jgi:multidrug efflux pump subunit AcrB
VAIGLIIDDTVVVIENIARHLTPGPTHGTPDASATKTPARKAAWYKPWTWGRKRGTSNPDARTNIPATPPAIGAPPAGGTPPPPAESDPVDVASSEITGAVIGSTLTTVIVFLPLALIAGVYGQFFASLSWALSIAVLVSMVISLTLVPVFAAKFLAGRPMPAPGRIYNFFVDRYEKLFETSLRFPWATLMVSFTAVGLGVVLFTGIPDWNAEQKPGESPPPPLVKGIETGLMPAMDEGSFTLDYFAPMGTPLARTERRRWPVPSKRSSWKTRTSTCTSGVAAPRWACLPPRPTAATFRFPCGPRRTTSGAC